MAGKIYIIAESIATKNPLAGIGFSFYLILYLKQGIL